MVFFLGMSSPFVQDVLRRMGCAARGLCAPGLRKAWHLATAMNIRSPLHVFEDAGRSNGQCGKN